MDIAELAKQFGGTAAGAAPATGGVDFASLAKEFGGTQVASKYAPSVPQVTPEGELIRFDAIPIERQAPKGVGDIVLGAIETPLAIGTGMLSGAVAPFVGVGATLTSGKYGTQEGIQAGEQAAQRFQRAMTYQPRSQTGQEAVGTIGETVQGLGLEALPFSQTMTAGQLAPAATRQALNIAKQEGQVVKDAIGRIPAVQAAREAKIAESYARAPIIDATNLAQKYGISVDPAVTNPTVRNRARSAMVGASDLDVKLSQANEPKWASAVKKDLGLDDTATLNADTFKTLKRDPDITSAFENVRKNPLYVADEFILKQLDDLEAQSLVGDVKGKAAKRLNDKIADIRQKISEGVSGDVLLKSIQDLNYDANSIYKAAKANNPISSSKRRIAELNTKTVDLLESMIEDTLSGKALEDYRAARTKYAKINSAEAATDVITGKVDPTVFAQMVRNGKPLSGVLQELGTIAGTFPEISTIGATSKNLIPRLTRAGPGGAIGGVLGAAIGGGFGAPIGIAAGAGVSEIARRVALNQMTSPGYQTSRAVPRDYRPQQPVNMLRPVEPGTSNIVPFDPRNALVEPAPPGPNFVFARTPDIEVGIPQGPAQLPPPSPQSTLSALAAEEARRTRMARMAEAEAGQAAAGQPRAPTSGEVLFDLDPVSGKLTPVSQGIRGATPETFQNYGASLASAADKVGAGRSFALSAEELAAWNRTKVDLAEVAPGMKALTDKAVAERMMDRKWVSDAIRTAREKAEAFAQIEAKSKQTEAVAAARANRERMLDLAEMLEDNLRMPRAKEGARVKGQGPKTRAAKNNLVQGVETLNKLIGE